MTSFKVHAMIVSFSVLLLVSIFGLSLWNSSFFGGAEISSLSKPPINIVFLEFYQKELRSNFFSGFLSVGAFLLSLKTFIVITMKKELYDTPAYKATWQKQGGKPVVGGIYLKLRELNSCLFWSILVSLVCTVSQFSIGFIPVWYSGMFCVWLAVLSCIYLIYSLFLVKSNLDEIISDPK